MLSWHVSGAAVMLLVCIHCINPRLSRQHYLTFIMTGIFTAFLGDNSVELIGVEPAGKGLDTPDNAATLTLGKKGTIHGMACYNLQDDNGDPLPVYSIASGLDYPVSIRSLKLGSVFAVLFALCGHSHNPLPCRLSMQGV